MGFFLTWPSMALQTARAKSVFSLTASTIGDSASVKHFICSALNSSNASASHKSVEAAAFKSEASSDECMGMGEAEANAAKATKAINVFIFLIRE